MDKEAEMKGADVRDAGSTASEIFDLTAEETLLLKELENLSSGDRRRWYHERFSKSGPLRCCSSPYSTSDAAWHREQPYLTREFVNACANRFGRWRLLHSFLKHDPSFRLQHFSLRKFVQTAPQTTVEELLEHGAPKVVTRLARLLHRCKRTAILRSLFEKYCVENQCVVAHEETVVNMEGVNVPVFYRRDYLGSLCRMMTSNSEVEKHLPKFVAQLTSFELRRMAWRYPVPVTRMLIAAYAKKILGAETDSLDLYEIEPGETLRSVSDIVFLRRELLPEFRQFISLEIERFTLSDLAKKGATIVRSDTSSAEREKERKEIDLHKALETLELPGSPTKLSDRPEWMPTDSRALPSRLSRIIAEFCAQHKTLFAGHLVKWHAVAPEVWLDVAAADPRALTQAETSAVAWTRVSEATAEALYRATKDRLFRPRHKDLCECEYDDDVLLPSPYLLPRLTPATRFEVAERFRTMDQPAGAFNKQLFYEAGCLFDRLHTVAILRPTSRQEGAAVDAALRDDPFLTCLSRHRNVLPVGDSGCHETPADEEEEENKGEDKTVSGLRLTEIAVLKEEASEMSLVTKSKFAEMPKYLLSYDSANSSWDTSREDFLAFRLLIQHEKDHQAFTAAHQKVTTPDTAVGIAESTESTADPPGMNAVSLALQTVLYRMLSLGDDVSVGHWLREVIHKSGCFDPVVVQHLSPSQLVLSVAILQAAPLETRSDLWKIYLASPAFCRCVNQAFSSRTEPTSNSGSESPAAQILRKLLTNYIHDSKTPDHHGGGWRPRSKGRRGGRPPSPSLLDGGGDDSYDWTIPFLPRGEAAFPSLAPAYLDPAEAEARDSLKAFEGFVAWSKIWQAQTVLGFLPLEFIAKRALIRDSVFAFARFLLNALSHRPTKKTKAAEKESVCVGVSGAGVMWTAKEAVEQGRGLKDLGDALQTLMRSTIDKLPRKQQITLAELWLVQEYLINNVDRDFCYPQFVVEHAALTGQLAQLIPAAYKGAVSDDKGGACGNGTIGGACFAAWLQSFVRALESLQAWRPQFLERCSAQTQRLAAKLVKMAAFPLKSKQNGTFGQRTFDVLTQLPCVAFDRLASYEYLVSFAESRKRARGTMYAVKGEPCFVTSTKQGENEVSEEKEYELVQRRINMLMNSLPKIDDERGLLKLLRLFGPDPQLARDVVYYLRGPFKRLRYSTTVTALSAVNATTIGVAKELARLLAAHKASPQKTQLMEAFWDTSLLQTSGPSSTVGEKEAAFALAPAEQEQVLMQSEEESQSQEKAQIKGGPQKHGGPQSQEGPHPDVQCAIICALASWQNDPSVWNFFIKLCGRRDTPESVIQKILDLGRDVQTKWGRRQRVVVLCKILNTRVDSELLVPAVANELGRLGSLDTEAALTALLFTVENSPVKDSNAFSAAIRLTKSHPRGIEKLKTCLLRNPKKLLPVLAANASQVSPSLLLEMLRAIRPSLHIDRILRDMPSGNNIAGISRRFGGRELVEDERRAWVTTHREWMAFLEAFYEVCIALLRGGLTDDKGGVKEGESCVRTDNVLDLLTPLGDERWRRVVDADSSEISDDTRQYVYVAEKKIAEEWEETAAFLFFEKATRGLDNAPVASSILSRCELLRTDFIPLSEWKDEAICREAIFPFLKWREKGKRDVKMPSLGQLDGNYEGADEANGEPALDHTNTHNRTHTHTLTARIMLLEARNAFHRALPKHYVCPVAYGV